MTLDLNEYIIDDRIFNVKFSCDLEKCKGACCTLEGTLGAPILEKEVFEIEKAIPFAKKYLSRENKKVLAKERFYIEYENELHLNNVDDNDCVFSFFEDGIAKCSIQKAYYNGDIKFIKPISCQLFPIRISGKNRNVLRYEKMYECRDALDKGEKDDVTIFEYLKNGIEREYGKQFYKELKDKFVKKDA